ncbi:hypothetical protein G6F56_007311 [Rhizopus delemar]|nr:hypothetical protein G6F56_007311 [Rhizopus delemar]
MPKKRAPISSRLRSRNRSSLKSIFISKRTFDKEQYSVKTATESSFSPRRDNNIYLEELQSQLSFARGTEKEKERVLKDENDRMTHSFGRLQARSSNFYRLNVAPPVFSKRMHHLQPLTLSPPILPSFVIAKRHSKPKKMTQKFRPTTTTTTTTTTTPPPPPSISKPSPIFKPSPPPKSISSQDLIMIPASDTPKLADTETASKTPKKKLSRRKRELNRLKFEGIEDIPPPDTPRACRRNPRPTPEPKKEKKAPKRMRLDSPGPVKKTKPAWRPRRRIIVESESSSSEEFDHSDSSSTASFSSSEEEKKKEEEEEDEIASYGSSSDSSEPKNIFSATKKKPSRSKVTVYDYSTDSLSDSSSGYSSGSSIDESFSITKKKSPRRSKSVFTKVRYPKI